MNQCFTLIAGRPSVTSVKRSGNSSSTLLTRSSDRVVRADQHAVLGDAEILLDVSAPCSIASLYASSVCSGAYAGRAAVCDDERVRPPEGRHERG